MAEGLQRRTELRRGMPLRRVPIARQRRHTGPPVAIQGLVWARAGGACERCGREFLAIGVGSQFHHRRPRQMGGSRGPITNSAANLVLVCRGCHAWIESNRAEAYAKGWLVHRWQDPGTVSVYVAWHGWAKLSLDGTYLAEGLRSDWESVEPASG